MAKRQTISDRYSGIEMEADLLGTGSPKARYEGVYKNYQQALEEVVKNPPAYRDRKGQEHVWDPEDPPTYPSSFPSDLHFAVKELLENEIDPDCKLRMYNASGSSLDRLHGVDALFELVTKGRRLLVTVDITKNDKKEQYKADVILHVPDEYVETKDEELREHLLKNWSEEIAESFRQKLEDQRHKSRSG